MTASEQKTIDNLNQMVRDMREENRKFREDVSRLVEAIGSKVEAKHAPLNFEMQILSTLQSSMTKAIEETLKGYNSPLLGLIKTVVDSRSNVLRDII